MVGHRGQAGEDVAQVREGILAVALAGDEQRVDDGKAGSGVGVTDEEPVLRSELAGADGVLDEVVVEPGVTVAAMGDERIPVREQVAAGLAELGLVEVRGAQSGGQVSSTSRVAGQNASPAARHARW